jgi:hypothetical protein
MILIAPSQGVNTHSYRRFLAQSRDARWQVFANGSFSNSAQAAEIARPKLRSLGFFSTSRGPFTADVDESGDVGIDNPDPQFPKALDVAKTAGAVAGETLMHRHNVTARSERRGSASGAQHGEI